jgi:hypothetical protein
LREAGYEVKPLAITPGVDKYGYSFRSSVEVSLPDKMKIELAALKGGARPVDDGALEASEPDVKSASEKSPGPPEESDSSLPQARKNSP